MKKYVHPLLLVMAIATCALLVDLFFRGVWGVAFSLTYSPNEMGDQIMMKRLPHDWAFIIAKTIWMTGFSVGLVGFLINFVKFLKLRRIKRTQYKYGSLNELTDEEFSKLEDVLKASECGMEKLREAW